MHDQLCKSDIECCVVEGQLLGGGFAHINTGVTFPCGFDERFRRVNRRDRAGSYAPNEFCRECTRTAPDIDDALPGGDTGKVGEQWPKRNRVPTHEPVVSISPNTKTHTTRVDPPPH